MPPPPTSSALLQRLDALTDLAHRCNGLLLAPNGQLTRTDAVAAAHAVGLEPDPGRSRGALELLLLLGTAVGILRAEGLRIRAAPLHDAWRQLDDTLRAGLLYAAWCQHATFPRPSTARHCSRYRGVVGIILTSTTPILFPMEGRDDAQGIAG